MRAQVLLLGGLLDKTIISISSVDGEWPTEIRTAFGRETDDGKIEAACYSLVEVSKNGPINFGHYTFVGNKLTAQTLIGVWINEETT